ncbi:transcriptional regulator [Salmonella enterica subsp. enterica]|uniref:Transcriptional regulator n=1 Tax=Salmonella enterica I TaxID=59201 RepID=A0A447U159_SALET|nr:transcriptional regulator [Salmonella enterica subsp. enterica]
MFILNCNIRHSGWNLIIMPCVFVIPSPFTRPKISLRTTYPPAWVTHYQSENYFAIDPVLKPENFRQGHLHWDDVLFHEAQAMWDAAQRFGLRRGVTQCVMLPKPGAGLFIFLP